MEWIWVVSIASVSFMSGKIEGMRLAIMDFPVPGLPDMRTL